MKDTFESHSANEAVVFERDTVRSVDLWAGIELLAEQRPRQDDVVIFHFAGHGFTTRGNDYLAFSDSRVDTLENCIRVADVIAAIRDVGVGRSLLLLDCCRDLLSRATTVEKFVISPTTTDAVFDGPIFTACRIGQVSQEHPDIGANGNGVFSASLASVIAGHRPIPLHQLASLVEAEALRLCATHDLADQNPQLIAPWPLGGFDFVSLEEVAMTPSRRSVVLISGPTEAGKTTVGRLLQESTGSAHIEMSSFVKLRQQSHLAAGGPNMSRQDFVEHVIWANDGFDAIAQDAISELRHTSGGAIVTGSRRPEEVLAFIDAGFDCLQFYLEANSLLRYERLLSENDDFHTLTRTGFIRRNLREYEWGLAKIGLMRGVQIVVNETSSQVAAVELEAMIRAHHI